MGAPYFVMFAGQPKKADGHIYVFGDGCTLRQAHISAESHFRTDRKLPTSVFVQTEKLNVCESFAEAERFVEMLGEMMTASTP